MAKTESVNNRKTETEKTQNAVKLFFQYPTFKKSANPLTSMQNYMDEWEDIAKSADITSRFTSPESVALAKDRFRVICKKADKLIKKYKTNNYDEEQITYLEEKKAKYEKLISTWSPINNLNLAKNVYRKAYDIISRYVFAYRDMILRETADEESEVVPFFKALPEPIARALNKKVIYESRLKTWKSVIEKLVTRMESLDTTELEAFYDVYGCSFTLTEKGEGGIESAYKLANQFCRAIEKMGCLLLEPRYVGPTDSRIRPEYRKFVKDYVNNPKATGYQALHICFSLTTPNGNIIKAECQISTASIKSRANDENGHRQYKMDSKIPIEWDFQNLEFDDDEFIYELDENGKPIIIDYAGILKHKSLTKSKIFRPIGV